MPPDSKVKAEQIDEQTVGSDLHRDIAARLARRRDTRSVAPLLVSCRDGSCNECGDVCPIKADRWLSNKADTMERALANHGPIPTWKVIITRDRWACARDELAHVSLGAIQKAVRRSLDALRQPSTTAIGIIDAWYGWRQWEVGANLLIAGTSKSELFDTFPSAALRMDEVTEIGPVLKGLLRSARTAKRTSAYDTDGELPGTKRRGEYYAWLARLTPGSRIFRYGCDRYFNPLQKQSHWKPKTKKGHPWPRWLVPYQYGSHPYGCECRICTAGRH